MIYLPELGNLQLALLSTTRSGVIWKVQQTPLALCSFFPSRGSPSDGASSPQHADLGTDLERKEFRPYLFCTL